MLAKVLRPFAALVAVLCLAALGVPAAGRAADGAAWVFDPDAVVEVDLGGLSPEELTALEADPDEYQAGTFELRVGGIPQGPPLGEVGIRLKGGIGSFRPLTEKAAFKVKFDEYVDDQTFFGLEKLTLNNMVQDPSMVHETLAYELFRALGLPASRTGYAFVRVNGEVYGLYLNVETLDEISLSRWFASTGHLYEADTPGVDLAPGGAAAFEVDEGDDDDLADLEALIAAANDGDGDWSEGMAAVADLEQMVRMWAAERYAAHWDGYSGIGDTWGPNNYYLHSDESGLFTMLPWGTDQTWGLRVGFGGIGFGARTGGVLFTSCLADASCCGEMYVDALEEVGEVAGTLGLDSRAADLAEMLAPHQALEADPRREYTAPEIDAGVDATREMITERPAELAEWLRAVELSSRGSLPGPCSPPSEEPDQPGPSSGQGASAGGSGTMRSDSPSLRPAAQIGAVRLSGSLISTNVDVAGAGGVTKRVTARLRGGWRAACADKAYAVGAGRLKLSCRLARGVRRQLASTPLRLGIEVEFTPSAGPPASATRLLTAPRARAS